MAGQVLLRQLPLIKLALASARACRIASVFRAGFAGLPEFGTLLAHMWRDGLSAVLQGSPANLFVLCDLFMEPPAGIEPATC